MAENPHDALVRAVLLALVMLAAMALSTQSLAAGGDVLMRGLSSAAPGNAVLWHNDSTRQLGPCAASIVVTPPCVDPDNRFKDCGDGTVYDKQRGLMWEKKEACGDFIDLSNSHCWANAHTWTANSTEPNGTLYTDFLVKLNLDSTDVSTSTCFANHCD